MSPVYRILIQTDRIQTSKNQACLKRRWQVLAFLATQTFTVPCNSIWPPPGKPIIPGQHSADAVRQGGAVRAGPRVGGQPQVRLI